MARDSKVEPGEIAERSKAAPERHGEQGPSDRSRQLTSLAVALYLFAQAVIVLINGAAGSSEMLMATVIRLAVLAMIGGMAIRGRTWARWVIGGLAALNVLSVILGTMRDFTDFSTQVQALTGAVLIALAAAAYLLLLSPVVRAAART